MHYDLGDDGWVSIPITGLDDTATQMLHAFVEESYRIVAPRALVNQLNDELTD